MCFYINIFFTAIVSEKFMTARTENKSVFFFFKQSENSLPQYSRKKQTFPHYSFSTTQMFGTKKCAHTQYHSDNLYFILAPLKIYIHQMQEKPLRISCIEALMF